MGVFTDFFIASDEELFSLFKGWKRAAPLLGEYVTKTVTNPFTKQSLSVRTRINEVQPKADFNATRDADFRKLPWIDQKGISTVEMITLACILLGWDSDRSTSEIHGRMLIGPPGGDVALCEMPPALVSRLAQLGADDIDKAARNWAADNREDAKGIVDKRTREREMSRPDSEWISRLSELAGLAKRAAEGRRMFLWISP